MRPCFELCLPARALPFLGLHYRPKRYRLSARALPFFDGYLSQRAPRLAFPASRSFLQRMYQRTLCLKQRSRFAADAFEKNTNEIETAFPVARGGATARQGIATEKKESSPASWPTVRPGAGAAEGPRGQRPGKRGTRQPKIAAIRRHRSDGCAAEPHDSDDAGGTRPGCYIVGLGCRHPCRPPRGPRTPPASRRRGASRPHRASRPEVVINTISLNHSNGRPACDRTAVVGYKSVGRLVPHGTNHHSSQEQDNASLNRDDVHVRGC